MNKDPDILVELTTTPTDFAAEVIAEALRERGIPAEVFSRAASMFQAQFSPLPSVTVSVRRADLERARAALTEIKASAREIDWDAEDTSVAATRPKPLFCPHCGYDQQGLPDHLCPECGVAATTESEVAHESVAQANPGDLAAVESLRHRRRRRMIKVAVVLAVLFAVSAVVFGLASLLPVM